MLSAFSWVCTSTECISGLGIEATGEEGCAGLEMHEEAALLDSLPLLTLSRSNSSLLLRYSCRFSFFFKGYKQQ
jgi:hypothetical protein